MNGLGSLARRFTLPALLSLLTLAPPALAQLPTPRLTTVFPLGVKRGATVDITPTGADVELPQALLFSRPGLSAVLNGAMFKVTAAADAAPGLVEVWLVSALGVSNSRWIAIGEGDELIEAEPNNKPEEAKDLPIGATMNGRIDNRPDVDWFKFRGTRGQRVFIECFARRLDSRLDPVLTVLDTSGRPLGLARANRGDDALLDFTPPVDGEFRVKLHDHQFNGSAEYFYRLAIHAAPVVEAAFPPLTPPAGAQVALLGRGLPNATPWPAATVNNDKLDTVAVPAAPTPAMDAASAPLEMLLLPKQAGYDSFFHRLAPSAFSSPFLLAATELPIVLEKEANDTMAAAQVVALPADVVGRVDRPDDVDWYRFTAKKGDILHIEGFAERAGYPADLCFFARQVAAGTPAADGTLPGGDLGEFDDNAANIGRDKCNTATRDPLYGFTAPADADYLLEVRDRSANHRGDARNIYRVRLAPPKPDFRLIAIHHDEDTPRSLIVRQGSRNYCHVFAIRQGGHAGEITLDAVGLPPGVSVHRAVMAGNQSEAPLVLEADSRAEDFSGPIQVVGTSVINGQKVTRTARAADLVWPGAGGQPRATRLTSKFLLGVRPDAPYQLNATPTSGLVMGAGSQLTLAVTVQRRYPDFVAAVQNITALHLPPNAAAPALNIGDRQKSGLMHVNFPGNVPPGTYSFLVRGTGSTPFSRNPQDPKAPRQPVPALEPSAPVTVTIVPPPLTLAANPNAATVKVGQKVDVKVTVTRANGYAGPVVLRLTTPPDVTGVTAPDVTVPADKNEGVVAITAAAGVPVGNKTNLTVRGEVTHNNQLVTCDAVLAVNVTP